MSDPQAENFEDVRAFSPSEADKAHLLSLQDECTLTWITRDGSPMSSIVNFDWRQSNGDLQGNRRHP
ncbi:MAG: hypothetical protein ACKO8T_09205 [Actinomycetota bacterium]